MQMYDILSKKKNGLSLTRAEIDFVVAGCVNGDIPDYQLSALLMAICINGMNEHETAALTQSMAHSGDVTDLSNIPGIKVDKHSTGGVGDKTTLIVAPIVAACGVPVAKMSGRGLGFSGGTIDKLESIPGYRTELVQSEFLQIVREIGLSVISQSGVVAPADKKLYALRDVTATVESIPLIAASIMSKKLACGADAIVLDVKTGSGAFMKTLPDSIKLAEAMVQIGTQSQKRCAALITDMDRPLGYAVGNALEVIEAIDTLRGKGPVDLTEVSLRIAAEMLFLADRFPDYDRCYEAVADALENGKAYQKLLELVQCHGGDCRYLQDTTLFPAADFTMEITAAESGWIDRMCTDQIGATSVLLGAGRMRKEDVIDHRAGIMLHKKTGDFVQAGEVFATIFTSNSAVLKDAEKMMHSAVSFSQIAPKASKKMILAKVTSAGTILY